MTSSNGNNKWQYIFKNSIRDFVLMAMISISMISILVVSNIANENTNYMIKQQAKDKVKDDADQKEAEAARTTIIGVLASLNKDVKNLNMTLSQTKILLDRLLLFEDQIHNENIIKFQKLDGLNKIIVDAISNSTVYQKNINDKINMIINQTK